MLDKQFRLDGRVALVTGGGKGLGKKMALALAGAGAEIAIAGRTTATCETACREVTDATGRKTLPVTCDVRSAADVEHMVDKTVSTFGRLDILINNAGVNIRRPVEEFALEDWQTVIETNLTGPFLCCKYAVPHMKNEKYGRIIMLGSMMGQIALPERTAYCASKGGVHMMTKVLALELAPFNITVNAIAPGPFMTEMNAPIKDDPARYTFFADRIPLGRWGDPHEIGGLSVYLASEASAFMTGSVITLDGGWTSQ